MAKPDLSEERPGGPQAQPGMSKQMRLAASARSEATVAGDDRHTAKPKKSSHHPVVLAEQAQRAADLQLRIADWITAFAGSMNFVYIHVALFTIWMLFIESKPWPTLTLIVSLEAIFLSTPEPGRRTSSRPRPTTTSTSRNWSSRPTRS
jgi:hypothetical protein